jgi:hypothetical protein
MSEALHHYLLVFDHVEGKLVRYESFEDADRATTRYSEVEAEHDKEDMVEVVLIGSDSFETVKRTHANYFDNSVTEYEYLADV